ncbi:Septin-6 [Dispira parvispora]|uniref:Septin-6 n=1 Tax=Dispira parvispora TaxID=1520584 RepID=A0A9W8AQA8_9FUNG|nr:Septin-6 [Dispira parvispora]
MPLEFALQHRERGNPTFPPFKHENTQVVLQPSPALGLEKVYQDSILRARTQLHTLNLMVVGLPGLGKTTFLNSFLRTDITNPTQTQEATASSVSFQPFTCELEEDGVTLQVTTVDSSGLGEALDRSQDLAQIEAYLDERHRHYMLQEHAVRRPKRIPDSRIHLVIYFLSSPKGLLNKFDQMALQALSRKANVIPVIPKADHHTPEELAELKKRLRSEFESYDLVLYPRPMIEDCEHAIELASQGPFAIVSSNVSHNVGGEHVFGRRYPWGLVMVENPQHSDMSYLRRLVMEICLDDLITSTHSRFYADFRTHLMRINGRPDSILPFDENFTEKLQRTQSRFERDIQHQEGEMKGRFLAMIQEKDAELRAKEDNLVATRATLLQELEQEEVALQREEAAVHMLEEHVMAQTSSSTNSSSKFGLPAALSKSLLLRNKGH